MTYKLNLDTTENILIRAPNWVGDVVMAVPFYECIRNNFPRAGLYCCIRQYAAKILKGNPWFDGIISADDKNLQGVIGLARKIRNAHIKIAFILPRSPRALLTARLGGAKQVFGYRQHGYGLFLNGGPLHPKAVKGFQPRPMTALYLSLADWLGLELPVSTKPRLFITEEEQTSADDLLKQYGIGGDERVIGLNPGARFGASKCWPPGYFARLAELLQKKLNCRLLLFVGPGEEDIASAIETQSGAKLINIAADHIDLAVLKPMIKRCDLLITNDTGPRHYAVAFDVPVVVIMGPTDPAYTNDNLEKTVVIRKDLACSPCHLPTCPIDHKCMTGITPEEVFDAALTLWEKETNGS